MCRKDGGDHDRNFAFAMPFEHARVAIANELPVRGQLNGTALKQITSGAAQRRFYHTLAMRQSSCWYSHTMRMLSTAWRHKPQKCAGGDRVFARKLYHDARAFVPKARVMLCGNALPELEAGEARTSMARWKGRTEFIDGEMTAEHRTQNALFERGEAEYRYATKDLRIKEYVKSPAAIAACTHIVLQAFQDIGSDTATCYLPASVLDDNDVITHVTLGTAIDDFVEFTGTSDDFVSQADLRDEVRRRTNNLVDVPDIRKIIVAMGGQWTQRGSVGARVQGYRCVRKKTHEVAE